MLKKIQKHAFFSVLILLWFTGFAFAADAATPEDGTLLDLFKPVYEAFAAHNYIEMTCLAVIVALALIKRWSGTTSKFGKWVHGDLGGTSMAGMLAMFTALAAAFATPGAHITWALVKSSLYVGVGAAGGFALLKNLVIEPLQKHLPAWAQPGLAIVSWIFDHGPTAERIDAEAKAATAGAAAVAANPPTGAAGVVGTPTEVK